MVKMIWEGKNAMKRYIRMAALVLIVLMVLPLCACGAPAIDEVKGDFKTLIEASYEINDIFFGEGLATYERGGEAALTYGIYTDFPESYAFYEVVDIESGYFTVDAIKAAASEVYSQDYLEGIYTMAFDGYSDGEDITTARYLEADGYFLRYTFGEKDTFDILEGKQRRYLFDTMEIVRPSSANYVNLKIDSYLLGSEEEILTVTLRFILENGKWRLDSPTY